MIELIATSTPVGRDAAGVDYLTLAVAPGEPIEGAVLPVTKRQLYNELGRLFEVVRLEFIRVPSPILPNGYPAWSCLMQRRPK